MTITTLPTIKIEDLQPGMVVDLEAALVAMSEDPDNDIDFNENDLIIYGEELTVIEDVEVVAHANNPAVKVYNVTTDQGDVFGLKGSLEVTLISQS